MFSKKIEIKNFRSHHHANPARVSIFSARVLYSGILFVFWHTPEVISFSQQKSLVRDSQKRRYDDAVLLNSTKPPLPKQISQTFKNPRFLLKYLHKLFCLLKVAFEILRTCFLKFFIQPRKNILKAKSPHFQCCFYSSKQSINDNDKKKIPIHRAG